MIKERHTCPRIFMSLLTYQLFIARKLQFKANPNTQIYLLSSSPFDVVPLPWQFLLKDAIVLIHQQIKQPMANLSKIEYSIHTGATKSELYCPFHKYAHKLLLSENHFCCNNHCINTIVN